MMVSSLPGLLFPLRDIFARAYRSSIAGSKILFSSSEGLFSFLLQSAGAPLEGVQENECCLSPIVDASYLGAGWMLAFENRQRARAKGDPSLPKESSRQSR